MSAPSGREDQPSQQLPAMARIASLLHDPGQLAALTAILAISPELPGGVVRIGAVAAVLRGGPNRLRWRRVELRALLDLQEKAITA